MIGAAIPGHAPPGAAAGVTAYRGQILHFTDDPAVAGERAHIYHEDGALVVRDGRVVRADDWRTSAATLPPGTTVVDCAGRLLVPGFIDTHVHYPQTDIIASYGEQLLEWLERYTFPTERLFEDPAHAREVASFFLDELLRNGTTTAMVFATVHPESVDAIFGEARRRGMAIAAGKVLMDRNCPEFLRDTAESGYEDSAALIERWHGRDRLHYAVTPRFAPTSTDRQLELAGRLLDEHEGVLMQSHVAENMDEVRWVAELFPWSRSYLDVYDHFGLLRRGAVYAHCIHLDARGPPAHGHDRRGDVVLRDVEPLSRQRPVRSRRGARARDSGRHRHRRRRRHELLDAADARRELQGRAARATAAVPAVRRSISRRSAERARSASIATSATSRRACPPTSSCSIPRRRR